MPDWATVRKYRTGDNLVRRKSHLDKVPPAPMKIHKAQRCRGAEVQHHRAIRIGEMPEFMAALRGRDGFGGRRSLRRRKAAVRLAQR
jgi:hypothetical protein